MVSNGVLKNSNAFLCEKLFDEVAIWEGALLCIKNQLPDWAKSSLTQQCLFQMLDHHFSVEFRVRSLSIWYKFFVHDSLPTVKKIANMVFWNQSFCGQGEFPPTHTDDDCFKTELWEKHQDSSRVMTSFKEVRITVRHLNQTLTCCNLVLLLFCSQCMQYTAWAIFLIFQIFNGNFLFSILADVKLITIIQSEGNDFAAKVTWPFQCCHLFWDSERWPFLG